MSIASSSGIRSVSIPGDSEPRSAQTPGLQSRNDYRGATLAEAIQKTLSNRGTAIIAEPTAFSAEFAADAGKVSQWQAFVRKLRWEGESQDLASVCKAIATFLSPPAAAALEGHPFRGLWRNAGPWTDAD
ncbi:MAG: hypothetical protein WKF77_31315 [Planctomycetaceae bacterium]